MIPLDPAALSAAVARFRGEVTEGILPAGVYNVPFKMAQRMNMDRETVREGLEIAIAAFLLAAGLVSVEVVK